MQKQNKKWQVNSARLKLLYNRNQIKFVGLIDAVYVCACVCVGECVCVIYVIYTYLYV